jgi:hypothetical protein
VIDFEDDIMAEREGFGRLTHIENTQVIDSIRLRVLSVLSLRGGAVQNRVQGRGVVRCVLGSKIRW